MSIRRRLYTSKDGEQTYKWCVDYKDGQGKRRHRTFRLKKEAEAFAATASTEVRAGVHVADSASATVAVAGALWLASCRDAGLERSTITAYEAHLRLHMLPRIGNTKLSALSIPAVRAFEDQLRADGRSPAMVRRVLVSLGTLLADGQERGLVARNIVRDLRGRRAGRDERQEKRQRGRLKVGRDIPTRDEIKALLAAATGRWRPFLLVATFCGLRASELRGLRWCDIDFDRREIRVHQRADFYGEIGAPKSLTSERKVPAPPVVLNALREWKLVCPKRDTGKLDAAGNKIMALELAFPNGAGKIEQHNNCVRRGLQPAWIAAGVTVETGETNKDGRPILAAKYTGLHSLRHFFASWCLNRREDGGLGLPLKTTQERMGHSTITLTADRYGHLFETDDDGSELAAASAWLAT